MAIILDEENKVVTVENQPDAPRALFKNLPEASTIEGGVGDVLINGVSIVDENGDADIPTTYAEGGLIPWSAARGFGVYESYGHLRIETPTTAQMKAGAETTKCIAPSVQHISAFYGMAKAAGDTTQAASNNAVGAYTDEAKIAIQKMLGIYEAPWELIRGDTFTNAEQANYVIDYDMNNQPFELTDVYLEVWLDGTNQPSSVTGAGRVDAYFSQSEFLTQYLGAASVEQGGNPKGACMLIKAEKGGILRTNTEYVTFGTDRNNLTTPSRVDSNRSLFIALNPIFTKINILGVTGTMSYRLYGKRKWQ